ncbi:MAG TPA: 2Fe-2S iron-sulfur cluster-binding protein [Methanocorpusculum sp.]|nr:2Fe-2S iron-sulfur cluster-binding protein [Methanocorpusculum sp.]
MNGTIHIKRNGRWVTFTGEYTPQTSVIQILDELNLRENLIDRSGNPEPAIEYDCGCLESVCGVCAMVVNGKPCLPCSTFFGEVGPTVRIEPLSKFPLIHDLKVSRLAIERHLVQTGVWVDDDEEALVTESELQYQSAACLHCGCCLEACPNYTGISGFYGPQWMNTLWVTCTQISDKHRLLSQHGKHGNNGCSKDQSCATVCPQKIKIPAVISALNRERIKDIFLRKKKNGK